MIKKLTKHGNSYAMVIDKPILELLKATPETPFDIISDGRSLVLTPIRNAKDEKKFDEADKVRDKIEELGFKVGDTKMGSKIVQHTKKSD